MDGIFAANFIFLIHRPHRDECHYTNSAPYQEKSSHLLKMLHQCTGELREGYFQTNVLLQTEFSSCAAACLRVYTMRRNCQGFTTMMMNETCDCCRCQTRLDSYVGSDLDKPTLVLCV